MRGLVSEVGEEAGKALVTWCKTCNQWYKGHSEETCKKKSGVWTLAKNPKEKDKKLPHQGGVHAVEDQGNNSASSVEA